MRRGGLGLGVACSSGSQRSSWAVWTQGPALGQRCYTLMQSMTMNTALRTCYTQQQLPTTPLVDHPPGCVSPW